VSDRFLIGLDIGTSCIKAAVFDVHGTLLARSSVPITLHSPHPGWAEQDPEEWWKGTYQALNELFLSFSPSQVAAIGLSGQCPGHVLVDEQGNSIGHAIIWRDQRAREEAQWLNEHISPAQAQEWMGTDFVGDATTPPARLLWLKNNRSEDWAKTVCILEPKDYIALRLTGKVATDLHSAYCLLHPEKGVYAPEFFKMMGISTGLMPTAMLPSEIMGAITETASLITGIPGGTPVITGTIDAYCDNLAGGVIFAGRAVDVAGTSEIISMGTEQAQSAAGVFPARIGRDGYFLCGPTQAGGESLRWLSKGFYPEFSGKVDFNQLEEAAKSVATGSNGLVFLPYLNGERAPLWDAEARGGFIGLTFAHTRHHATRAVYEGVGYAVRHVLEACEEGYGAKAAEVIVCGGASASAFWNQIKADILQRTLIPTAVSETGCLGAAILASIGVGLHPDLEHACHAMIVLKQPVLPNKSFAHVYEQGYATYRALYPALKEVFTARKG
jgi:xylulokinase